MFFYNKDGCCASKDCNSMKNYCASKDCSSIKNYCSKGDCRDGQGRGDWHGGHCSDARYPGACHTSCCSPMGRGADNTHHIQSSPTYQYQPLWGVVSPFWSEGHGLPEHCIGGNRNDLHSSHRHQLQNWGDDLAVSESDAAFRVSLAVPGVEPQDISVSVKEGASPYLEIEWRRTAQVQSSNERLRWMGRSWGTHYKAIPIPSMCDPSAISADLSNGSMVITMPKKHGAGTPNSRSIKIRTSH